MDFPGEVYALFVMWLGLVSAVVLSIGRIALLLRRQWLNERALRLQLAMWRATTGRAESPGP
jgi:hypothetical protein